MKDITLRRIEEVKISAESYIAEILEKLEKETGCICQSLEMYIDDENNNKLNVNINLQVKHRIDLLEK